MFKAGTGMGLGSLKEVLKNSMTGCQTMVSSLVGGCLISGRIRPLTPVVII